MQITIDLSDKYVEGKVDEALESKIIREVTKLCWEKFNDKVEGIAEKVIKAEVSEELDATIRKETRKLFGSLELDQYGSKYTLEEWIYKEFKNAVQGKGKSKLDDSIKESAKGFAQKIKDRYDMHFATQVITKMRETDMLKEGVEKALFGEGGINKDKGDQS